MNYRIRHLTEYNYGDDVFFGHNVVHLKPRRTLKQLVLSHSVTVSPTPVVRSDRLDFFGNAVTWFSLQEAHKSLSIVAESEVDVATFSVPTSQWWPAWEQVADSVGQSLEPELLDARQFTYESPFVQTHAELREYARPSFAPGRPLLDAVTDLTHRIHGDFTFDSTATTIGTPVLDVLRHRHGVCQDFAHLQIGCLRSLGLPARYVSGYLVTKPPAGQKRLVGGDASHAWVSVYFPNFGWIDFDPTNGIIPTNEHITVAWARDYTDVSPARGVVVGGSRHSLYVSVDVAPL